MTLFCHLITFQLTLSYYNCYNIIYYCFWTLIPSSPHVLLRLMPFVVLFFLFWILTISSQKFVGLKVWTVPKKLSHEEDACSNQSSFQRAWTPLLGPLFDLFGHYWSLELRSTTVTVLVPQRPACKGHLMVGLSVFVPEVISGHDWFTWQHGRWPGPAAPWRECTNRLPPNSACSDAKRSC